MDNKVEQVGEIVRFIYNKGASKQAYNSLSFANQIIELLNPDKVKLPKAAYEWMERIKNLDIDSFDVEIGEIFHRETNREPVLRGLYITDKVSISDLYDAYRYGYELEETEEERIKREMNEYLLDEYGAHMGDGIDELYRIARGLKRKESDK